VTGVVVDADTGGLRLEEDRRPEDTEAVSFEYGERAFVKLSCSIEYM
jgi:hypothetical protein